MENKIIIKNKKENIDSKLINDFNQGLKELKEGKAIRC